MRRPHRQGEDEPVAKRRREAEPEAVAIPDDVLEEVLLRLPVKSLLRFKSVCKSWRDTIASPRFERCQLQLSKARRPSMLIMPLRWTTPPLRMDKIRFFAYPGHGTTAELVQEKLWSTGVENCRRPIHCDGLVVAAAVLSPQIFVCNPATKELVALPAGTLDYCYGYQKVGFGVDPSTAKYKVVRIFWRYCNEAMTDYSVGCEVFTLGSRAWKPAADPPYMVKSMNPVCLPGAIYWSVCLTPFTQGMLRFDLQNEDFTEFPAPTCMELADFHSSMIELAGKLCYAHAPGHTVQLWIAEDDGVLLPKWFLYRTIELPWPTRSIIPFSAYEGGIYLHLDLAHIYRYDTELGALGRVVDMNQEMAYFHPKGTLHHYRPSISYWSYCVMEYSESLVSIRGH
ncbi:hypothetical protein ACP70R_019341 [Stipagrostis hirtigluma subsp. patula]